MSCKKLNNVGPVSGNDNLFLQLKQCILSVFCVKGVKGKLKLTGLLPLSVLSETRSVDSRWTC